ncbi:Nicotinamidase-related amidase [Formivibrio citricus]|uniref:Nicotinamidase-related amidase n=1 Tax=Formivibrio citricus TaxID=83765 RepID=A0A1I4VXT4_9NEIS|nr:cysteine hydrolase [Formivibrio citricus]SFN06104.1 Nicotinamidase-related amidase [Formivibrio citricus]
MKPLHLILSAGLLAFPALGETLPRTTNVIEEWSAIKAPPAPPVASVTVDAKTAALLVLDMQNNLVNPQSRPRAVAAVPGIAQLLGRARAAGMLVAHSNTPTGAPADIVPALAPLAGEPVVRSGVDKFFRTDLEKILMERGIKTVIVVGTAPNGAVLHTATGASLRGMKVLIPVDGMPGAESYSEQYTAWHMLNAPGTRANATLTRLNWIKIQQ